MDSIKKFVAKYKVLFGILSFLSISLPLWIDGIWDLAEKVKGKPITMSHSHIAWAYLVTVPIGLIMFAILIWAIKSSKPTKECTGNRRLSDIPEIIYKMHSRLTALVACMPPLTETEMVDSLRDDYLDLCDFDETYHPELKQITPLSDRKVNHEVMGVVLDRLLEITEVEDVKSLLIRIGGLMNLKGKGIKQVRDNDSEYTRLESRLAMLRPEIPAELNTVMDDYLSFSFGFISLTRLLSSISYEEIANGLPPKYSAEMGIWTEQVDRAMNELLAKVRDVIQELAREEIFPQPASHKANHQT